MKFQIALATAMLAASCTASERRYRPDYEGRPELDHLFSHKHQEVLSMRGRMPRRVQVGEDVRVKLIKETNFNERPEGPFYDWRDYEPGSQVDPYDVCYFPYTEALDTPQYQELPAICKEEMVWRKILEDDTRDRFYTGEEFDSLFEQDSYQSYEVISDDMPHQRVKKTHPVAVHSKIQFIAHPDSPYTGVFRGAKYGILRISEATQTTPEIVKTAPGFGMKLFRDGMNSANVVTMFAFDGQTSFNFFKWRWSNVLAEWQNECARQTVGKKFATVSDWPIVSSTLEMSQYDEYGNKEEHPHWPFEMNVQPYDVYGWTDEYQNDFQDQLSVIPYKTVLFKVIGFDVAPAFGGEEIPMGWIVSMSDQRSSLWGDRQLFFQHQKVNDDIQIRPEFAEWLPFWTEGNFDADALVNPAPMQHCPFFYLFERAGFA